LKEKENSGESKFNCPRGLPEQKQTRVSKEWCLREILRKTRTGVAHVLSGAEDAGPSPNLPKLGRLGEKGQKKNTESLAPKKKFFQHKQKARTAPGRPADGLHIEPNPAPTRQIRPKRRWSPANKSRAATRGEGTTMTAGGSELEALTPKLQQRNSPFLRRRLARR